LLKVLIIKGKQVKKLLDMVDVLDAVEGAFREKGLGRVQMPAKTYLYYDKYGGDLRVMPSYLEALDISAVKVVTVHPGNLKHNLPSVIGTIILINPETGVPLAIMDGTWITAMRTGAASSIATKYLARKKGAEVLGIVGAGVQATTQLMGITRVMTLREVKIYDINPAAAETFARRSRKIYRNVKFTISKTEREAVEGADVLVTVTPSRVPHVKKEWVHSGMHINAIGADAPGKEELDPTIFDVAKVVVDDMEQACHSGELNVPLAKGIYSKKRIYAELGEIVAGKKQGRASDREVTVFVATGLALEDAVTAKLVYDKALEKGVGLKIDLV
jgi:alanine dehydrogenase